jgi:hypothetical protein
VTGQEVARLDGEISAAAGRKGIRAELDGLRERMRACGFSYDEIADEFGRRYRMRPREAYRHAYGWTLDHAAACFNALAARAGTDAEARASLTASRLCEFEKWPSSSRRPSAYALIMLAQMYETDVLRLLDLDDHEQLPPRDRLLLIRREQAQPQAPSGRPQDSAPLARGFPSRDEAGGASLTGDPQGMSVSLPCVPARLVIEISGMAPPAEQRAEYGLSLVRSQLERNREWDD